MDLTKIYNNRFDSDLKRKKNKMWAVLCDIFFSKYIKNSDIVLDVAAGCCDFINNITCKEKYAIDLNEDVLLHANDDVKVYLTSSTDMKQVSDATIDVAFISNFFEHLPSRENLFQTLSELRRILKNKGRLLILQPNIRFAYKEYWDFIDHVLPLSDRSLQEALEISGFKIKVMIPQFLPYTTKSKLPQHDFFIKLYLMVPIVWRIMGKQCFAVAVKDD